MKTGYSLGILSLVFMILGVVIIVLLESLKNFASTPLTPALPYLAVFSFALSILFLGFLFYQESKAREIE